MNAKIKIITAMVTFGTIGIFVRYIPLPSSIIALVRGVLATFFLLAVMACGNRWPDKAAITRNLALLLISGALIGFNWILLLRHITTHPLQWPHFVTIWHRFSS